MNKIVALSSPQLPASQLSSLRDAIAAAVSSEAFENYGHAVGLSEYPKSKSLQAIYAEESGEEEQSIDELDAAEGAAAVASFAQSLVSNMPEAAHMPADADDVDQEIRQVVQQICAGVSTFNTADFAKLQYLGHGTREDGDPEMHMLAGQRADGSWLVLRYSHNPF